jgi:hypothetical protein
LALADGHGAALGGRRGFDARFRTAAIHRSPCTPLDLSHTSS